MSDAHMHHGEPDLGESISEEVSASLSEQDEFVISISQESIRQLKLANQHKEEIIRNLQQDRKERKRYANKIFALVALYLVCVGFILSASGLGSAHFSLSDSVLLTLLGTTTANVLGTFFFVANYLFK